MYQISGGGYGGFAGGDGIVERLLDHRHLEGPAGRDHGADSIPSSTAATRCTRARAGRGSTGAGFGLDYEIELLRGRRGRAS